MPSVAVRCSVCGRPAIVVLRYARLALCEQHFVEYVERRVSRTIERYRLVGPSERVVVAVSGGKDSVTLAYTLYKLLGRERLVYLYIDLGIKGYSERLLEKVRELSERTRVPLLIVSIPELLGVGVYELAVKARRPVCSVCGLVKRYIMNAVAVELGAVLATGHTLDDALAYIIKDFMAQDYEQLRKWVPRVEGTRGASTRIRPLIEVSERETLLYVAVSKLPFHHEECPHRPRRSFEDATKEWLNRVEEDHPGTKIGFLRRFVRNASKLPGGGEEVKVCRYCGLVSRGEVCSFCRLTERVFGKPMGPEVRRKVAELVEELGLKG